MRDMKALKELLALDRETLDKMSSKPFKPCCLDVIVSMDAPHLYSEENLAEIKNFYEELHQQQKRSSSQDDDDAAERSPKSEHQDLAQEAVVFNPAVSKKPRSKKNMKKVTGKRSRQSDEEEEVAINNPAVMVRKKSRKTIIILKRKNNNATPSSSHSSPPELPVEFKNKIRELNGTDIVFVMHKRLYKTDLEKGNDRLSMPEGQIECEFLTEAEKAALEERDSNDNLFGLEVAVLDPCLREFTLKLKKWDMNSSCTYNLGCRWWKCVVQSNDLKPNDQLDVWSFRAQGKRYFLLNKL